MFYNWITLWNSTFKELYFFAIFFFFSLSLFLGSLLLEKTDLHVPCQLVCFSKCESKLLLQRTKSANCRHYNYNKYLFSVYFAITKDRETLKSTIFFSKTQFNYSMSMILYVLKKALTWVIFHGVAIDEVRDIVFVYFQTGLYQNLFTLEAWIPGQYISYVQTW